MGGPVKAAHHTRNGMSHQRHSTESSGGIEAGGRGSSESRAFNSAGSNDNERSPNARRAGGGMRTSIAAQNAPGAVSRSRQRGNNRTTGYPDQ